MSGKSLELITLDGYRICLALEVKYYLAKLALEDRSSSTHTHVHRSMLDTRSRPYAFIIELKNSYMYVEEVGNIFVPLKSAVKK